MTARLACIAVLVLAAEAAAQDGAPPMADRGDTGAGGSGGAGGGNAAAQGGLKFVVRSLTPSVERRSRGIPGLAGRFNVSDVTVTLVIEFFEQIPASSASRPSSFEGTQARTNNNTGSTGTSGDAQG